MDTGRRDVTCGSRTVAQQQALFCHSLFSWDAQLVLALHQLPSAVAHRWVGLRLEACQRLQRDGAAIHGAGQQPARQVQDSGWHITHGCLVICDGPLHTQNRGELPRCIRVGLQAADALTWMIPGPLMKKGTLTSSS